MNREDRMDAVQLLSRYRGALMGFAALWIVLMHCWLLIVPNRPILGAIESFGKQNGILGLDIFFFYSGLSQTYAIRKGTLGRYYVQRFKRVLLPFWIMAPVYAISHGWSVGKLFANALCISYFTENIYAYLWFVPSILVLYLLFPAYHRMMMRAKDKTAFCLCTICVWLCASMLLSGVMRADVWHMTNRLPGFFMGVFAGELAREKQLRMTRMHWVLCVLALAVSWMLRTAASRGQILLFPLFQFVPETVVAVSLCLLLSGLLAALEGCGGVIHLAAGALVKSLSFVGTFTLELYCVHEWLFGVLYSALEGHVSYLSINMIVLPLLVLAGWGMHVLHMWFWRAVETANPS